MIQELFRRLKPLYPTTIARLWIEYQTADVERKREIDELVTILAIKRLGMMIGDEKIVLDAPPAINALTSPPGVEFEEWADALTDTISTSYLLMQGARNVLKEGLLQAHERHGKDATLAHAYQLLARELDATRSGSRRYGWLE